MPEFGTSNVISNNAPLATTPEQQNNKERHVQKQTGIGSPAAPGKIQTLASKPANRGALAIDMSSTEPEDQVITRNIEDLRASWQMLGDDAAILPLKTTRPSDYQLKEVEPLKNSQKNDCGEYSFRLGSFQVSHKPLKYFSNRNSVEISKVEQNNSSDHSTKDVHVSTRKHYISGKVTFYRHETPPDSLSAIKKNETSPVEKGKETLANLKDWVGAIRIEHDKGIVSELVQNKDGQWQHNLQIGNKTLKDIKGLEVNDATIRFNDYRVTPNDKTINTVNQNTPRQLQLIPGRSIPCACIAVDTQQAYGELSSSVHRLGWGAIRAMASGSVELDTITFRSTLGYTLNCASLLATFHAAEQAGAAAVASKGLVPTSSFGVGDPQQQINLLHLYIGLAAAGQALKDTLQNNGRPVAGSAVEASALQLGIPAIVAAVGLELGAIEGKTLAYAGFITPNLGAIIGALVMGYIMSNGDGSPSSARRACAQVAYAAIKSIGYRLPAAALQAYLVTEFSSTNTPSSESFMNAMEGLLNGTHYSEGQTTPISDLTTDAFSYTAQAFNNRTAEILNASNYTNSADELPYYVTDTLEHIRNATITDLNIVQPDEINDLYNLVLSFVIVNYIQEAFLQAYIMLSMQSSVSGRAGIQPDWMESQIKSVDNEMETGQRILHWPDRLRISVSDYFDRISCLGAHSNIPKNRSEPGSTPIGELSYETSVAPNFISNLRDEQEIELAPNTITAPSTSFENAEAETSLRQRKKTDDTPNIQNHAINDALVQTNESSSPLALESTEDMLKELCKSFTELSQNPEAANKIGLQILISIRQHRELHTSLSDDGDSSVIDTAISEIQSKDPKMSEDQIQSLTSAVHNTLHTIFVDPVQEPVSDTESDA